MPTHRHRALRAPSRPAPRGPHPPAAERLERRALLAAVSFHPFTAPADAVLGPAAALGGVAWFFSRDTSAPAESQRTELWKTDGTPAGTVPTAVALPGSAAPKVMAALPGRLLFDAADPQLGRELWVTDGTPAGTAPLSSFARFAAEPRNLTVAGNQAFFTVDEPATGNELWRTDGTPQGTRPVTDLLFGTAGSNPFSLTAFNDRLYFVADGGTPRATRVWSTDGTAAGPSPLLEVTAFTAMHVGPTPAGPRLLFGARAASSAAAGTELWASDGTPAGTSMLPDLYPTGSSSPHDFETFNGEVFFVAQDNAARLGLWRTNGTAAATAKVTEVPRGFTHVRPKDLTAAGGRLYFTGETEGSGLWSTDGTAAGTREITPAVGPALTTTLTSLRRLGDRLYFVPSFPLDAEPWASDGTPAGTAPLRDITPGAAGSRPVPLADVGASLLLASHDPAVGAAPWVTDGTPAGTTLLRRLAGEQSARIDRFVPAGDTLYALGTYSSPHRGDLVGLWATDATTAGTRLVYARDTTTLHPPTWAHAAGGKVFFGETSAWASDGAAAGTRMLHPGPIPFDYVTQTYHRQAVAGSTLYFTARPAGGANELWRSDGTPEGTAVVKRFGTTLAEQQYAPGFFQSLGDRVFFYAYDAQGGYEPWVSDGTEAGTRRVLDLSPGPANSASTDYVFAAPAGGRVFFRAAGPAHPNALWVTDGTAEGTRFVKDLPTAAAFSLLPPAGAWASDGGVLYFIEPASPYAFRVWRSDGTESGTWVVLEAASGYAAGLATWRGDLYIATGEVTPDFGATGGTLYRSDGTPGSAAVLKTFPPDNTRYLSPGDLVAAPDGVYFHATGPGAGRSLWKTDGTPAGTLPVRTAASGAPPADPTDATPFAGGVWFTEAGATFADVPPVAGRHAFHNNSAADGRDPAADARDDKALDRAKRALLPGGRAASDHVTHSSRGINGLMIDLALPGLPTALAANQFDLRTGDGSTWTPIPAAPLVSVRRGAGRFGADRVTLTLPDGLVKNTWLRVTVKASPATGLSSADVFYFGNLTGDTAAAPPGVAPAVDARDLATARSDLFSTTPTALARSDVNHDGRIDAADVSIVRRNLGATLSLFTAATAPPPPAAAPTPAAAARLPTRAPASRRRVWEEPPPDPLSP